MQTCRWPVSSATRTGILLHRAMLDGSQVTELATLFSTPAQNAKVPLRTMLRSKITAQAEMKGPRANVEKSKRGI